MKPAFVKARKNIKLDINKKSGSGEYDDYNK
jgi:hypothetical protein